LLPRRVYQSRDGHFNRAGLFFSVGRARVVANDSSRLASQDGSGKRLEPV